MNYIFIIFKAERDIIATNTNQGINTFSQTENEKVSHDLSNYYSTQTEPRSFSNQSTNTQYPPQTSTQTESRTFSNQSTNTQHKNVEDCQCETEEINQPLIPFQSNFARQLHQNEVMRQNSTSLPLQTNNIDQTPQQMEIGYDQPSQQMEIAYNQQWLIQYIIYDRPSQQQQALNYNKIPQQMEIAYDQQSPIHHMRNMMKYLCHP